MKENEKVTTNEPAKKKEEYSFKVRNNVYWTDKKVITGREICVIAGLIPPERYSLSMKLHGNQWKQIGLEEQVDLTRPGIEKFTAVALDQTEG